MFANEFVFLKHVQLLAGGQLLAADAAREALEVEDAVSGLPHQVLRGDALQAARALGSEAPVGRGERGERGVSGCDLWGGT